MSGHSAQRLRTTLNALIRPLQICEAHALKTWNGTDRLGGTHSRHAIASTLMACGASL
ncbi:hypothetical protein F01_420242 [Burkholderia cenocepacia]|nr:hypothetical protein F01_420242 [Burkholderia cenocepacia]